MKPIQRFRQSRTGILWAAVIAPMIAIVATITWLVVIMVSEKFVDLFSTMATGPMTVSLGQTSIIQGSIVIAIIDAGMAVWFFVAVFNRKGEEQPIDL